MEENMNKKDRQHLKILMTIAIIMVLLIAFGLYRILKLTDKVYDKVEQEINQTEIEFNNNMINN